jgi:hypothetical protein
VDTERFDSLVKSLARGSSRRSVLKGLLGLGATSAGVTLLESETNAARRPTPTPKPLTCPGNQHWNGWECVCTSGQKCGPTCCLVGTECCDGACCFGHCYGEELCCSYDNWCEATNECCPSGAVCTPCGCIDPEKGTCCTNEDCPAEYECCGGECCVSGFCAGGEMCCATGVCGDQCMSSPENECCNGVEYDPETQVCCDDEVFTGNCCVDADCDPDQCIYCRNNVCGLGECG